MGISRVSRIVSFLIVMATATLMIQLTFVANHSWKKMPTDAVEEIDVHEEVDIRDVDVIENEVKKSKTEEIPKQGTHTLPQSPNHGAMTGDVGKLWKMQGVKEDQLCTGIISGMETSLVQSQQMLNNSGIESLQPIPDTVISSWTFDCKMYQEKRQYILNPLSENEAAYPIAYSIVVHKDASQVERLFQNIYMPQNVYCIHVDLNSADEFKQAMVNLVSCFDNAFISSKLEHVTYRSASRLKADINCMEDLLRSEIKWKYLINLSGQDFPLKTNLEIVLQMKAYNGINDITGVLPSPQVKERTQFVHEVMSDGRVMKTNIPKPPPPYGITIYFGNAYNIFSRDFVLYVTKDPVPRDFLKWSEDTFSPDEHYWVSLQRIPGTPGGYAKPTWGYTARAIKWEFYEGKFYPPCGGKYVREVCVYGVRDLRWLTMQHHLLANKFDMTFDPIVVQCLEAWLKYRLYKPVNWTNFPHNLYDGDRT